jgi:hypothetical protein
MAVFKQGSSAIVDKRVNKPYALGYPTGVLS